MVYKYTPSEPRTQFLFSKFVIKHAFSISTKNFTFPRLFIINNDLSQFLNSLIIIFKQTNNQ